MDRRTLVRVQSNCICLWPSGGERSISSNCACGKCGSSSLFHHLPQLSLLLTYAHNVLIWPHLPTPYSTALFIAIFTLNYYCCYCYYCYYGCSCCYFLVLFSWSNISFWLTADVLVMRDVVKERNTAKTEKNELYWSYWVNHVICTANSISIMYFSKENSTWQIRCWILKQ